MNLPALISTAKTGFELTRSLREAIGTQQIQPNEVVARLIEIQSLILDLQGSLHEVAEENRALKIENEELQRQQDLSLEVTFEQGVAGYKEFPFCPTCWLSDRKLTRLSGPWHFYHGSSGWACDVHKVAFKFQWTPPQGTV
jgi:hypothetical protein